MWRPSPRRIGVLGLYGLLLLQVGVSSAVSAHTWSWAVDTCGREERYEFFFLGGPADDWRRTLYPGKSTSCGSTTYTTFTAIGRDIQYAEWYLPSDPDMFPDQDLDELFDGDFYAETYIAAKPTFNARHVSYKRYGTGTADGVHEIYIVDQWRYSNLLVMLTALNNPTLNADYWDGDRGGKLHVGDWTGYGGEQLGVDDVHWYPCHEDGCRGGNHE